MASKTGRVLRTGLYRRQCGDEADKYRLRPSGNDPSRKQAKRSKKQVKQGRKASKRPRSSGVCSPASPRREARPTRRTGPDQPRSCGAPRKRGSGPPASARQGRARRRPRAARAGRSPASLAIRPPGLVRPRPPGQRASRRGDAGEQTPHQDGSCQKCCAAHSIQPARKNSGASPKIRREGSAVNSNNGLPVTIKSAEIISITCLTYCLCWPDMG